jgi:uncharacterized protein YbaR (Trm112 family)/SAM-dependent methyltransferase
MHDILVCPQCRQRLDLSSSRRSGAEVVSGRLRCEACGQAYPVSTSVPSMFPDPHPYPIGFLPPEDIIRVPRRTRKDAGLNDLALTLRHYGKERFLKAVRRPGPSRQLGIPRSLVLNQAIRRGAYRHSRESFIRRVMEPVMEKRFWPDPRCQAIVATLREIGPRALLDIATGPGGLLCSALPRLRHTRAVGLEICFDKCRTVLAEARHFGFAGRLQMVHGDARLMPFSEASFDCVSGWTAAYHISRYEEAIRECVRVLKPGGHFVGTFHAVYPSHCPDVLTREEEEEFIRRARLPLNIREVCETFRQAGFSVARKTRVGNSHLVVARKKRR